MKKITWIFLLVLVLAACAPDPRNVADAYATTTKADQDALDQAQAREQDAARAALDQAEREQTSAARTQAMITLLTVGGIAAAFVLAAIAIGTAWGAVGTGRAVSRAAIVKANLIHLDEHTRQFPLFVQYASHGKFMLCNPNTGSIYELDTRRPEVKGLIEASGAIQLAGAIAREARQARDPAGVSIIRTIRKGGNDEI
jgi:hypothetical protein